MRQIRQINQIFSSPPHLISNTPISCSYASFHSFLLKNSIRNRKFSTECLFLSYNRHPLRSWRPMFLLSMPMTCAIRSNRPLTPSLLTLSANHTIASNSYTFDRSPSLLNTSKLNPLLDKVSCIFQMCNGHPNFRVSSWLHRYILNSTKLNFSSYFAGSSLSNVPHNLREGGQFSLVYLSEIISKSDEDSLSCVCDNRLYKYISEGLTCIQKGNYHLTFEICNISAASVDHVWLILGCEHGCCVDQKQCKQMLDYVIVLDQEQDSAALQRLPQKQFFINLLNRGIIVLCDVAIQAEQKLYIENEEGSLVLGSREPHPVKHLLRFENNLSPKTKRMDFIPPTFPRTEKLRDVDLGESEWVLLDFNDCLGGNFPLKFK